VQLEQIPADFFNERRRAEQIRLVGRRLMGRSWASMMALQVIGSQFLGAFAGGSFAIHGAFTYTNHRNQPFMQVITPKRMFRATSYPSFWGFHVRFQVLNCSREN